MIQLSYFPLDDWLAIIAKIPSGALFDYFASQSLTLVVLTLLSHWLLQKIDYSILTLAAIWVPVAFIHGWISTSMMFVAQYNRAFTTGQAVMAVIVAATALVIAVRIEPIARKREPCRAPEQANDDI